MEYSLISRSASHSLATWRSGNLTAKLDLPGLTNADLFCYTKGQRVDIKKITIADRQICKPNRAKNMEADLLSVPCWSCCRVLAPHYFIIPRSLPKPVPLPINIGYV